MWDGFSNPSATATAAALTGGATDWRVRPTSFHRSQDVELHQLLEGDGRVEVLARQPQRLMQPFQHHLHPEGQLRLALGLHVLLCSLSQSRHAVQLAEELGEG